MKTLTKILSVTALIVLCVCLFTLTAFANGNEKVIQKVEAQAATCTEPGYKAYYLCENGHMYDVDDVTVTTIPGVYDFTAAPKSKAELKTAEAKGHKYPDTDIAEVPATCAGPGIKAHAYCDNGCGTLLAKNGTGFVVVSPGDLIIPQDETAHVDTVIDSKDPTNVSPGYVLYQCSVCLRTRMETLDALGIDTAPFDLYYVIALHDTWAPGEEPLTFSSPLIKKLNDESGPNANYVGVRIGQSSLYENSYDTFDFWSWDEYVKLGEKTMQGLEPGHYHLWVYDKNHPSIYTTSCEFWVLDVPTLEPYSTDKHVVNSSKSLRFVTDGEIVPGTIKVGSRTLYDANDYFVSNDRKSVTLSPDFLNARQTGTYTISAKTKDGYTIKTNFYILSTAQASSSPRTGDESQIGLWAAFLLLSGAAIVVMVPKLRKNGVK